MFKEHQRTLERSEEAFTAMQIILHSAPSQLPRTCTSGTTWPRPPRREPPVSHSHPPVAKHGTSGIWPANWEHWLDGHATTKANKSLFNNFGLNVRATRIPFFLRITVSILSEISILIWTYLNWWGLSNQLIFGQFYENYWIFIISALIYLQHNHLTNAYRLLQRSKLNNLATRRLSN